MGRDKEKRNAYQREYQLNRYHLRRKFALDYLGGACLECGSVDDLEIDHIEPKKKTLALNKMWSVSEERFIDELNKCQILCKECHRTKTNLQHHKNVRHGEGKTGRRLCRCDVCRPLKNQYSASFKK